MPSEPPVRQNDEFTLTTDFPRVVYFAEATARATKDDKVWSVRARVGGVSKVVRFHEEAANLQFRL